MLGNKRAASFWHGCVIKLKMCRASSVTGESKSAGLLGYFQQERTISLDCPVFCMHTIYQRWQQHEQKATLWCSGPFSLGSWLLCKCNLDRAVKKYKIPSWFQIVCMFFTQLPVSDYATNLNIRQREPGEIQSVVLIMISFITGNKSSVEK